MRRLLMFISAASMLAVFVPTVIKTASGEGEKTVIYRSPFFVVSSQDGKKLYASDKTADCIVVIDASAGKKLTEWPVVKEPTGLALSADGKTLYAASFASGTVSAIDTTTGKVLKQAEVGVRPMEVVSGGKSSRLYICNRASNSVSVVDLKDFRKIADVAVDREPCFASLTPDENTLVVANGLPTDSSNAPVVAGTVSIIDTKALRVTGTVKLCNGATNLRGIVVDPNGNWAYCVHTISRFHLPTSQLDRGWMNTSGLSIIDLRSKQLYTTVLLDSVDHGAADPYALAISPDSSKLFVSLGGTHEVQVVEIARLHDLLMGRLPENLPERIGDPSTDVWKRIKENPEARRELVNDLGALDCMGLLRRFSSGGIGPRGICVNPVGSQLFAANYFSGSVAAIDTKTGEHISVISAGNQPPEDLVRRGERIFQDASICYQSWQSCTTCHPDGRSDGLRWDLLNDGMGNPKKTRSLVKSFETSPVMSMGVRADAKTAVRAGFRFILFNDGIGADIEAVDAYLKSLEPEPSPYLGKNNSLSSLANNGRKLFFGKARCADCHKGPLFTDLKLYQVVPPASFDRPGDTFITPKLVEVYRSAPYLHDGRAATLMDMLTTHNKDDKHGMTSKLSKEELSDLVEYLMSL
ncbi:MAG TPA: c-type cytochrome [Armatimonadota bacterium]|mgnify:CR=1 FL=1|nr:c-type cytochrome [Armatimonadota bacterium]